MDNPSSDGFSFDDALSKHLRSRPSGPGDVSPSHKVKEPIPKLGAVPDYVSPLDILQTAINIGFAKASSTSLSSSSPIAAICRVTLKAMLSGSYLGFSISLTLHAVSMGWDKVSAAILFPTGFVMLILMGNDLATGNFALLPMAYWTQTISDNKGDGNAKNPSTISVAMVLVNWSVVYLGNFLGTLTFLLILWGGMTHFGARDESKYDAFKAVLCAVSSSKVNGYLDTGGGAAWFASMFNGILCNWMVTMGVMLSLSSRSTIGKIVAMYIPILIFICLGFEHSIVNLFLLPAGMVYQCGDYNFGEWWLWNQIPVTLGNVIGGVVLTAFFYFSIWAPKLKKQLVAARGSHSCNNSEKCGKLF